MALHLQKGILLCRNSLQTRVGINYLWKYSPNLRALTLSSVSLKDENALRKVGPIDPKTIFKSPEEKQHEEALAGHITIDTPNDITWVSGIPEEHIKTRKVLIKVPTKNSMQSGTNNIHRWRISFDTRERWDNYLMGWASSGDPLSNMEVDFLNKEEAIEFCERNGWAWELQQPPQKTPRAKSYADNFSWNKRTRRSSK